MDEKVNKQKKMTLRKTRRNRSKSRQRRKKLRGSRSRSRKSRSMRRRQNKSKGLRRRNKSKSRKIRRGKGKKGRGGSRGGGGGGGGGGIVQLPKPIEPVHTTPQTTIQSAKDKFKPNVNGGSKIGSLGKKLEENRLQRLQVNEVLEETEANLKKAQNQKLTLQTDKLTTLITTWIAYVGVLETFKQKLLKNELLTDFELKKFGDIDEHNSKFQTLFKNATTGKTGTNPLTVSQFAKDKKKKE